MKTIPIAAGGIGADAARTDDQALARAAARDPAAFAQLYRKYVKPVYGYALARVGSAEEAQDLTSQTFLAALQGISGFRGQSKFSTWLFGIARYKCADYFRRRGERRQVGIEMAEDQPERGPGVQDTAERDVRFEELARKARLLPPDQAEALTLRIFGGLSAAEVSQVMGRSEPAVKMLVHRAVCELRTRMGEWAEAEQ